MNLNLCFHAENPDGRGLTNCSLGVFSAGVLAARVDGLGLEVLFFSISGGRLIPKSYVPATTYERDERKPFSQHPKIPTARQKRAIICSDDIRSETQAGEKQ